ncbi:hypothetical protein OHC33_001624 [Knufia fluminis]|uniref:Phenazine biosynthesis protein n=1 Tax=Knufia fluminis TaxID=191047 RepID=A0AAN8ERT0_9EURO|nr:hypothetical protein OHC33_001624 [Knufia fluminis]
MASGPHTFVICTVFSPERFKGNPLAIVSVRGNALTQQRKSLIAREFGYSETVFLHDAPGPGLPRRIDIFTEQGAEIPFAGHPVIGVTHYIFTRCERFVPPPNSGRGEYERQQAVLMTKAGPVPVFYNPFRMVAACAVPHNVHLHETRVTMDKVLNRQPQIQIVPTYDKIKDKTFPVVSGVKGMTFVLIDLTDAPEILGSLQASEAPDYELDADWRLSFQGALYYTRQDSMHQEGEPTIHPIQARMISQGVEDPGTGSACCALACYLATDEMKNLSATATKGGEKGATDEDDLAKKTEEVKLEDTNKPETKEGGKEKFERHVYAIQQGVEMGRLCTIAVEVDLRAEKDGSKSIANVTLSGRANFFARGELEPHP